MSDNTKRQQGIIGFFDILGYSSFLENNEPEDAATVVLETLLTLKSQIIDLHKEQFPIANKKIISVAIDQIECLVFSDTIVLALMIPQALDKEARSFHWTLFIMHSILLYRYLFLNGLPIRGAITYGDFLIKKNMFRRKTNN